MTGVWKWLDLWVWTDSQWRLTFCQYLQTQMQDTTSDSKLKGIIETYALEKKTKGKLALRRLFLLCFTCSLGMLLFKLVLRKSAQLHLLKSTEEDGTLICLMLTICLPSVCPRMDRHIDDLKTNRTSVMSLNTFKRI